MQQKNVHSGNVRDIRPPHGMAQPSKPVVEAGPTMCLTVPKGAAGKTIQVPHPKNKSVLFPVNVPAGAKAGQSMLIPIPPLPADGVGAPAAAAPAATPADKKKSGWSTGGAVAAGVG